MFRLVMGGLNNVNVLIYTFAVKQSNKAEWVAELKKLVEKKNSENSK